MKYNVNFDGNHSNTDKTFESQETKLPKCEIKTKLDITVKENEQNQGQSENDTIRKSLVGFAWGVLASFLIAAGTVCVQVCTCSFSYLQ